MKLVAAKVTYYNDDYEVISEIKFGYETIAQISEDGTEMSLVFVVPTERSRLIEDRSVMTTAHYCMPIAYEKYELLPDLDGYDFYPPKRMENMTLTLLLGVKTDYKIVYKKIKK